MFVFPEKGVTLWGQTLRFKTWKSFTDTTTQKKIEDVGAYLDQLDSLASDSTLLDSGAMAIDVERMNTVTSIQFKDNNSSALFAFFEALLASKNNQTSFHIMHYGDSQIESDRMTSYLRQKWQETYSGGGPGLLSPVPLAPASAVVQTQSSNWKRYTAYGYEDEKTPHNQFGALCSFGRFAPFKNAADITSSDTLEAWIELRPSGMAQPLAKRFTQATLTFGKHQAPLQIDLLINDSLIESRSFEPSASLMKSTWAIGYTPSKMRFVFRGADSPDVQHLFLEGAAGVRMSNVALRGSSGTVFKKINSSELGSQLVQWNTQLIILQFGGNSVPYVTQKSEATAFGNFFRSQIQQLKKLAPNASFVVIGPSDMSTSIEGVFTSWPGVPLVRDAMKEAAFAENCGFWDMYEVMGGPNSMVSWVSNTPPYAGPDYTHFTPLGARKMAELFYKAMDREMQAYMATKAK